MCSGLLCRVIIPPVPCCPFIPFQLLVRNHTFDPEEARSLADFVTPLLQYDPLKRPEPADLLGHPWLAKPSAGPPRAKQPEEGGKRGPWWRFWGGGTTREVRPAPPAGNPCPHVFSDGLDSE